MYALAVQKLPQGQEWLYEVKFDGYRCLAGRDSTGVTLWSRRENLFTKQFPHIAQACERLPPNTLIDGEIVALDESGRVSFNLLQHHRSKAQALVFYAFDVLIYRGRSVLKVPLYFRQEVLRRIFEDSNAAPIGLSENIEAAPTDMIRVAKEFGFEASSPSARTLYAAKVRNGFVPQDRGEVASRFKGLEVDTCPFVNLPERKRTQWALTKEEMKNCVWLKPGLVARVEFTEWTPDNQLRHSKFVGLRDDKDAREVVREIEGQL
jgi:ATP-dependent DNA ligase